MRWPLLCLLALLRTTGLSGFSLSARPALSVRAATSGIGHLGSASGSSCGSLCVGAPGGSRRARTIVLAEKKFILFQIIDDILDYLTNMGGYTGFTEEMLKSDSAAADLNEVDMTDFGRPKAQDDTANRTTDILVILLIVGPLLGLFAAGLKFGTGMFP